MTGYGRFSTGLGLTGGDLELSSGRRVLNTGGDLVLIASNNSLIQAALTNQSAIGSNNTSLQLANAAGSVGIFESTGNTGTALSSVGAGTVVQLAPNHTVALTAKDGNVGIGTTTPLSKFQVYAASTQNNETDAADAFGLSSTVNLSVINSDTMAQYKGGSIGLGGRITTGSSPYLWSVIKGGKENATDTNYAGYLGLWTMASDGHSGERIRITSSGNVGIGTTSPLAKLEVAGGAGNSILNDGTNIRHRYGSDPASQYRFTLSGNLGITGAGNASGLMFVGGDSIQRTAIVNGGDKLCQMAA